jgi:quercetin dioxygenase-like cupin family protein
LQGGLEVPLHTHSSAEVLFVLSGTGLVQGIGAAQEVKPGSTIYIPAGTVHGFKHTGEEPGEVLQLYAPGGPEARFKDPANTAGTTPFTGKLRKRGPRPLVGHVNAVKPLKILAGQGEVRILLDEGITGDKAAYLGALSAQPGAVVPPHRHADSSEYLFVIEGQAEMKIGGRTIPVQAGDGVQVPPGIEHAVSFSGEGVFKAIQFYTPAGPEQRFKGGAK